MRAAAEHQLRPRSLLARPERICGRVAVPLGRLPSPVPGKGSPPEAVLTVRRSRPPTSPTRPSSSRLQAAQPRGMTAAAALGSWANPRGLAATTRSPCGLRARR